MTKQLLALAATVIMWAAVICAANAPAIASSPSEYEIKAAFLYNFANFVEWPSKTPADASGILIIGIYGDDPFGETFEQTIAGKSVNRRKLEIKRFRSIHEIKPCHILFVSSSEEGRFGRILDAVKDWHVLTVSESDSFIRSGGIINFIVEEKKVRFEISTENARKAGLKISSKLLKLAKVVR